MVDLGYESHNEILNLGSLAIFLVLYFLKVILYFLLLPLSIIRPQLESTKNKLKKGLFFNDLIALLEEAYFEMLISTYLQFKAPLNTANGEVSSTGFGYISVFLVLLFLPAACIWVLSQPLERLREEEFKNSWEDLYTGMKTRSKWEVAYYFGFMLRRQMYVAIAFLLLNKDYEHIMAMNFLNLAWIIYLGGSWPHQLRAINMLDLANEFVIIVAFLHLFIFTEWGPDLEMQYLIGWSMNGFVALLITFNLFFVFKHGGH